MILQILILFLILGVAPMGAGMIIDNMLDSENRSLGVCYLSGFLGLLAVFQLITVPIVFLEPWGFPLVVRLFTLVSALLAGCGVVLSMHRWRKGNNILRPFEKFGNQTWAVRIQWIIVVVLILFQLVMAVTHASFDGDDAYYVVQSVITEETDTLYRILPYTGLSTNLDYRHSMAVFPIWIAYLARMSGLHATIVSHTVLPVVLIPVTYWIYYEIGKKLLREKKEQLPGFMILVIALQIFGNVSIYPGATFLLTRTWQGKSMLANVVIPAVFMLLLWIFEGEKSKSGNRRGLWLLLFLVNIVAAMMSTASVLLNLVLIGVIGLVLAINRKDWRIAAGLAMTCIPCVIYGLLYLLV